MDERQLEARSLAAKCVLTVLGILAFLALFAVAIFALKASIEDFEDRYGPVLEERSVVAGKVTSVETRQEPAFLAIGAREVTYVYYKLDDGEAGAVASDSAGYAGLAGCRKGDVVEAERTDRWNEGDKEGTLSTTYDNVRLATREAGVEGRARAVSEPRDGREVAEAVPADLCAGR